MGPILVAGMGPGANAGRCTALQGLAHAGSVPRMAATGDGGRVDEGQQGFVVAHALAEVGIQFHLLHEQPVTIADR